MVSDLKMDLVMTSSQRRPNVQLISNPAVDTHLERNLHMGGSGSWQQDQDFDSI